MRRLIRSALERVFGGTPGRLRREVALAANLAALNVDPASTRLVHVYDPTLGTVVGWFDKDNNIITTGATEGAK